MDVSINRLGVVVAAVSVAKPWQRLAGVSDEQLKIGAPRIFIGSFLLVAVGAVVLAAFIGREGVVFGLFAGLAVGLGWVATMLGVIYLFERRPIAHWAVNAGYAVLAYTGMGAIIGAMQA